ncbi:glycosyltransferase family 4 protein [Winogradskya consettensis]|uniref:Glycosyl transferase n=1 Tax=Winogradskya consettensis TaxID=113560 RepID=A0A919W543_9ACTN|nr:glycosyltransferase family 4 protein [Actinoplanes consettensis]GIM80128.1 glycosyl transferase [Actinoplanes consettensis]
MNVLIVSSYFPPHVGGVEVVAQQQARSLAEAGHTVVVATSQTGGAPGRERQGGYDVVRLPVSNVLDRRTGVPFPLIGPAFLRGLKDLVARCDVVHVHDVLYPPPQAAAWFARRAGKPMYVTQHIEGVHHPNPLVLAAARLSARVAGGYLWRHARRVVAPSALVADYLRARGVPADKVVAAPNGIDTAAFAPGSAGLRGGEVRDRLGLPSGRPIALFAGRMVPRKGFEQLIAAADDAYDVVLAGTGHPGPLPAGVHWVGPVSRADLAVLYRLADVFVLPSVGDLFPLVVQEAMACGLPIVTTDDERYDAYGVDRRLFSLVAPEPEALRTAIRAVVADAGLRRRMGEHSRRLAVRHFDWRVNQQLLVNLYDRDVPAVERQESACPSVSSF